MQAVDLIGKINKDLVQRMPGGKCPGGEPEGDRAEQCV